MTAAPPFRILVVDDEAPQRELLAGFLVKQGYEVVPAVSGAEGLERLQRETFDLILTDHRMPQMSGLDLLKAAREINPEVPVVVMTAYGSVEQAVAAMKAGAYDYLGKPIDLMTSSTGSARSGSGSSSWRRCARYGRICAGATGWRGSSGRAGRCRRCWEWCGGWRPAPPPSSSRGRAGPGKNSSPAPSTTRAPGRRGPSWR